MKFVNDELKIKYNSLLKRANKALVFFDKGGDMSVYGDHFNWIAEQMDDILKKIPHTEQDKKDGFKLA